MLKISAFYLKKQKSFIPKKRKKNGHCQYQNKKALFTDPIFSEGFAAKLANLKKCQLQASCRIDMATTFSKQWFLFLASMKAKNLSKKKRFFETLSDESINFF